MNLTVGLPGSGADITVIDTADDEINQALAIVGAAGGGTVSLLPGFYPVGSAIRCTQSNVTLEGAGAGQTIIQTTPDYQVNGAAVVSFGGVDNFAIRNLTVDAQTNPTSYNVIENIQCSNGVISNCEVLLGPYHGYGIWTLQSDHVQVLDNQVDGGTPTPEGQEGIEVFNSNDVLVSGNTVENIGHSGIGLISAPDAVFGDLSSPNSNIQVLNNTIVNCGYGVGIGVQGPRSWNNIEVQGNTLQDIIAWGIFVQVIPEGPPGTVDATVENPQSLNDIDISNNSITFHPTASPSVANVQFPIGIYLVNVGPTGVCNFSNINVTQNNVSHTSAGLGSIVALGFENFALDNNILASADESSANSYGVNVTGCSNFTVNGNSIDGDKLNGISIADSSFFSASGNSLRDWDLGQVGAPAIGISASSHDFQVSNNSLYVTAPPGAGILAPSSIGSFSGNTVYSTVDYELGPNVQSLVLENGAQSANGGISYTLGGTQNGGTADYADHASSVAIDLAHGIAYDETVSDTLVNVNNASGSAFDDTIAAGASSGTLDGGDGTNTLVFSDHGYGVAVDLLGGGASDAAGNHWTIRHFQNVIGTAYDDVIGPSNVANVLDGLGGSNTVWYSLHGCGVAIDLAAGVSIDGNGVTDTLRNFQNATGSSYNDTIAGTSDANVLDGLGGIDTISYANSNRGITIDLAFNIAIDGSVLDTLLNFENVIGSPYNDAVGGTPGANVLDGGAGNDTVSYYAASQGVSIDLAAGTAVAGSVTDIILNFENATGSSYNDTIAGTSDANVLDGLGGIDTVSYYAASQGVSIDLAAGTAVAGSVTDTILNFENANGSSYNDTIAGTSDANVLDGLGGTDTVSYANSNHGVTVDLSAGVAVDGSVLDTLLNFENVIGSPYNDAIGGTPGANVLDGGAGNDTVSYYAAPQGVSIDLAAGTAVAGSVTDTILNFENANGSSYNDTIAGSSADNIINGLGGADLIFGGDGNDTFVCYAGQTDGDTFMDFASGDEFMFAGFGTAAQGASLSQASPTQWLVQSGLDGHSETITLVNGAILTSSDYLFT